MARTKTDDEWTRPAKIDGSEERERWGQER